MKNRNCTKIQGIGRKLYYIFEYNKRHNYIKKKATKF